MFPAQRGIILRRLSSTSIFQPSTCQHCKLCPSQLPLVNGHTHIRSIHSSLLHWSSTYTYHSPYPQEPAASLDTLSMTPATLSMTPATLTDILNKKKEILAGKVTCAVNPVSRGCPSQQSYMEIRVQHSYM